MLLVSSLSLSSPLPPLPPFLPPSLGTYVTGYQYGRVPWANTEVAVLLDEKGVLRFCLHELCTRVLTEHSKADVFNMVKDLNLPMEQGDMPLLKKLQALGMHSNRWGEGRRRV